MRSTITPPPLIPGDEIRVVAPSGPFEASLLERGLAQLSDYRMTGSPQLAERRVGFLAADDGTRLAELQEALDCDHSKAVLVARGGYGLGRIIDQIDWNGWRRHPKWVCGFSDATLLHQQLSALGAQSIHGPNATTLASARDDDVELLRALLAGKPVPPVEALECWTGGRVTGPLVGGNLTVLFCEAAAGRWTLPDSAVLFLEDVTETSYRIDRMLSSLKRRGAFAGLAGVVVGDFTDCSAGKFGVPAMEVLHEQLTDLGIACVAGFPAGHGSRQRAFVHGQLCDLDATQGRLEFLP